MRRFLAVTALALALIFGCFQGALWQYDRYQVRHSNNELIRNNVEKTEISESSLSTSKESEIAWRKIKLIGVLIQVKNSSFATAITKVSTASES